MDDLNKFFISIIEQDEAPIVICSLNHKVIYMNQTAAKRYSYAGGYNLIGKSVLDCHNKESGELINKVISWFEKSPENNRVFTGPGDKENKDVYMIALRDGNGTLIGYYEKHAYRDNEKSEKYYMP